MIGAKRVICTWLPGSPAAWLTPDEHRILLELTPPEQVVLLEAKAMFPKGSRISDENSTAGGNGVHEQESLWRA